jgi:NOL1/NOP2/fmu family ribosome biogenesis protein
MAQAQILNSREIKKISSVIIEQFGTSFGKEYVYVQNAKNKVFLITQNLTKIDFSALRTDRFGLYVGEAGKTHFRLSLEGSALLASIANKEKVELTNVVDITSEEMEQYFKGNDISKSNLPKTSLVLLRYNKEVFGCAAIKNDVILNFLPKTYRGTVIL